MAKYLDSGAFQAALVRKQCGPANQRYTDGWNDCLLRVKSMVSNAPAADVAPVVRCANCKHRMLDVIYGLVCNHSYGLRKIFHDSYCPYGEYQTNAGGGADG